MHYLRKAAADGHTFRQVEFNNRLLPSHRRKPRQAIFELQGDRDQPQPTYRYNPDYRFKGVQSCKPFTIKPGSNNPVGSVWIGLSSERVRHARDALAGKVAKADSHGCVRNEA